MCKSAKHENLIVGGKKKKRIRSMKINVYIHKGKKRGKGERKYKMRKWPVPFSKKMKTKKGEACKKGKKTACETVGLV